MKDVVLLFDTACMYEIVILNYFLKATGSETVFCSIGGKTVTSAEGYSLNADVGISEISIEEVRSIIVPGGDCLLILNDTVYTLLKNAKEKGKVVAGICAGVDVLEKAGILQGVKSIRSTEADVVRDSHIITARPNAYVDFAIEVGKELALFEDEADLQETIDFWKLHKRVDIS